MQITVVGAAAEVALGDVLKEEKSTVSGTSAQTSAVDGTDELRIVRVMCDTGSYVHWATSPTALVDGSAGRLIGANNPEYFSIKAGLKLAAILAV